ncbi:hypothetical protein BKA60DRAFT_648851 [Fusarium oxysporum]|nr:hypothetical protein BKA60DRAFT_648851 [Fusarium oxysporum]
MSNNCGCHQNPPSSGPAPVKHDYSKAQALTAILNPGNQKKVLLYQTLTVNGTLGYEYATFSPDQSVKSQGYNQGVVGNYDEQPSPLSPVTKWGSNIVSMVMDGVVNVYGVSAHTNSMCLLSPVYQPLKLAEVDKNLNSKIAGCTNGQGQAWLYFQKSDGGKTGYIYEKSLTKLNEKPTKLVITKDAKLDTDIVAFYDGRRRWIAYQTWMDGDDDDESYSQIQIVCLDDESANHYMQGSKTVLDKELIELAATSAVKNGKELIYIYFRGQASNLYWSAAELTKNGAKFSTPENLKQIKMDRRSSLAVLPHDEGIVVYGIKKSGDGIEAFLDPFVFK